jgi:cell division protein FtsW
MNINSIIKGDKAIWAVVIILSIVSTVVVYSSTGALAYKRQNGNTEFYLLKHVFTLIFGLCLMVLTHNIKYFYYNRLSQIAIFTAIPLLAFTLLKGSNLNEASRWIQIPVINLTFQTSDFAKLALISYVARMLAIKQEKLHDFKAGFLPIILPIFVICGLILPANFSTAAVLFTTCFSLMFIGRVHYKHMFALVGMGVVAVLLILMIGKIAPKVFPRFGTWMKRIENFQNKDSKGNFQVEQAKIAIAVQICLRRGIPPQHLQGQ